MEEVINGLKTVAYDRKAAVEYARKWAYGRNPAYYDFSRLGGDCTNYASQCLYAGSDVMNYTARPRVVLYQRRQQNGVVDGRRISLSLSRGQQRRGSVCERSAFGRTRNRGFGATRESDGGFLSHARGVRLFARAASRSGAQLRRLQ